MTEKITLPLMFRGKVIGAYTIEHEALVTSFNILSPESELFEGPLPMHLNIGDMHDIRSVIGWARGYRLSAGYTRIVIDLNGEASDELVNLAELFDLKAIGFAGIARPVEGVKDKAVSSKSLTRAWCVHFDLAYDGGGDIWTQYYRTKIGAQISKLWRLHISSWGGTAELFKNPDKEK